MVLRDTYKVLLVAVVCFAGALVVRLVGLAPADVDYLPDEPEVAWNTYDYATLVLSMLAGACTIAFIQLKRAGHDSD